MTLDDTLTRWMLLIAGGICARVGVTAVHQGAYMYAAQAALVGIFAVWAWRKTYVLHRRRAGAST